MADRLQLAITRFASFVRYGYFTRGFGLPGADLGDDKTSRCSSPRDAAAPVCGAVRQGEHRRGRMRPRAFLCSPHGPTKCSLRDTLRVDHHRRLYVSLASCLACSSCAPAMRLVLVRVWMRCIVRASKLEYRVLCIVVIYHLHTRGSLGCDGVARGSRRRDRPFRHWYTNVDTPCSPRLSLGGHGGPGPAPRVKREIAETVKTPPPVDYSAVRPSPTDYYAAIERSR